MDNIQQLIQWIDGSDRIVFFGGAGVSTESGIPDFRSVDGLYHQQWDDPPETILSHTYYERYPEKFFAFYRAKLLCEGAKPNAALDRTSIRSVLQSEGRASGSRSRRYTLGMGLPTSFSARSWVLITRKMPVTGRARSALTR